MVSRSRRLVVDGTRRRTGRARVANPRPPRRLRPVIGALFALALLAGAVRAGDIQVPADHPTIQAAIDAATDGDRVLVGPGRYPEAIRFLGKDIQVIGTAGRDATVIDATGLGTSTVSFDDHEPDTALLQGFTITGGTGQLVPLGPPTIASPTWGGGGVAVFEGSVPTLRDCRIINNHVDGSGGGVLSGGITGNCGWLTPCEPSFGPAFFDCLIEGNSATDVGGGLWAHRGAVSITRCQFVGNSASMGGGVDLVTTKGTVLFSHFVGNVATQDGGGLRSRSGMEDTVGCVFVRNVAGGQGGGAYTSGAPGSSQAYGTSLMAGAVFRENHATRGGGLFKRVQSGTAISSCLFVDNVATGFGNAGSGVYLDLYPFCYVDCYETRATVYHCTFIRNDYGGDADEHYVRHSIFRGQQFDLADLPGYWVEVNASNIEGGWAGNGSGNIDAEPGFVDPEAGDFHLAADSPCLDTSLATFEGALDFEGDPRDALPDMGADEFAPHLYVAPHTEQHALPDSQPPAPGGPVGSRDAVVLRVIGAPGERAWIVAGFLEDEVGLPTRFGALHVPMPWLEGFPLALDPLPATGVGELRLPEGLLGPAARVLHVQALVGDAEPVLTNSVRIEAH